MISTAFDSFAIRVLRQWGADADKGAAFTELRFLIIKAEKGNAIPLEKFARDGRLKPAEIQREMSDYLRDRLAEVKRRAGAADFQI